MMSLLAEYTKQYENVLVPLSKGVEASIREVLVGIERIDAVSARAKSPERFVLKAEKKNDEGNLKYEVPMEEIQDQIGARIVVKFLSDVDRVTDVVKRYFSRAEDIRKEPEKDSEFGYFGHHFILYLTPGMIPKEVEYSSAPRFFELQIKTIFQHAWSEASHDLGYKEFGKPLDAMAKRKLYLTSAQSWGADQMFDELFREFGVNGER